MATVLCSHGTLPEECPHCSTEITPVDDSIAEEFDDTPRLSLTREKLRGMVEAASTKTRRDIYINPHPDFIKKIDGIGPEKKGVVQFLASQSFRMRGICAINSAGEWWSVTSIKIGGQEQFATNGVIKLSLLRGHGLEFLTAIPGMMIEITVINDTNQVRSIELMLEGQYISNG